MSLTSFFLVPPLHPSLVPACTHKGTFGFFMLVPIEIFTDVVAVEHARICIITDITKSKLFNIVTDGSSNKKVKGWYFQYRLIPGYANPSFNTKATIVDTIVVIVVKLGLLELREKMSVLN